MAFPAVAKKGMDVPAGPTGHLSSNRKPTSLGGSKSAGVSGKAGLTGSQMKMPLAKGKSLAGRRR